MSDVSRETRDRLAGYEALVRKWNPVINLVGPATLHDFQSRHVEDSLQLMDLVPAEVTSWVDLGSGGGLPAIVIAIALADRLPRMTLIESDVRKAAFLKTVARELSLSITVLPERIEQAVPANAQVLTARALAPLHQLLSHVSRHLADGGVALLPKGQGWRAEIEQAQRQWQFHFDAQPSRTNPEAVILKVSGVAHA